MARYSAVPYYSRADETTRYRVMDGTRDILPLVVDPGADDDGRALAEKIARALNREEMQDG